MTTRAQTYQKCCGPDSVDTHVHILLLMQTILLKSTGHVA